MTTYITAVGTENHRELKPYKSAANAKKWAKTRLTDFKEWCDRHNLVLAARVQEGMKEISNLNMLALPPGRHNSRIWRFTDDHSGYTVVVELWHETGAHSG